MLAKLAAKKQTDQDDDAARQKGQQRPPEERYRLRVDGQFKRSFQAKEAAMTAAQAIKKAFPVVNVVVVDRESGASEMVSA